MHYTVPTLPFFRHLMGTPDRRHEPYVGGRRRLSDHNSAADDDKAILNAFYYGRPSACRLPAWRYALPYVPKRASTDATHVADVRHASPRLPRWPFLVFVVFYL